MLIIFVVLLALLIGFRNNKNLSLWAALLVLGFVVITRFGIGADYLSYEYRYYLFDVSSIGAVIDTESHFELGFSMLIYVFRTLGIPYHYFIVTLGLVGLVPILLWIRDNSTNVGLSVMTYLAMFFCVWNLSAIRQFLVLSFAMYFIFNQKKNYSIFTKVLISLSLLLFHSSAIIITVFVFVEKLKISRKTLLYILFFSMGFSMIPINSLLPLIAKIPFLGKISYYFVTDYQGIVSFKTLVRFGFGIGLIILYPLYERKGEYYSSLAKMSILGFSLFLMLLYLGVASERLTIYTFFFLVILIPLSVEELAIDFPKYKYAFGSLFLVFISMFYYKELNTMVSQSQYEGKIFFSYPNITYPGYDQFRSPLSYLSNEFSNSRRELKDFNEYINKIGLRTNENSNFSNSNLTVVRLQNGNHAVINQSREIVFESPSYPQLIDIYISNSSIETMGLMQYSDLKGNPVTFSEINEALDASRSYQLSIDSQNWLDISDVDSFEAQIRDLNPASFRITMGWVRKLELPFEYYVANATVNGVGRFFYFDKDGKLLVNVASESLSRYNSEEYLTVISGGVRYIYDNTGHLLWVQ